MVRRAPARLPPKRRCTCCPTRCRRTCRRRPEQFRPGSRSATQLGEEEERGCGGEAGERGGEELVPSGAGEADGRRGGGEGENGAAEARPRGKSLASPNDEKMNGSCTGRERRGNVDPTSVDVDAAVGLASSRDGPERVAGTGVAREESDPGTAVENEARVCM